MWGQESERTQKSRPHFDARKHQTRYEGPSASDVGLDQLSEIRIGYFGPFDPEDPEHGALWRAANAAVKEANAQGGYRGKPFRLVPAWSEDPWGTGVRDLTKLVYRQRVWAIIGGPDGSSTHLAEQVVAKARLPLVSPIATDKTVNLANVPWMFSLAPGDHIITKTLAPRIASDVRETGCVLIAATDHDSFHFRSELRKALTRLNIVPRFQFEFTPGVHQLDAFVARVMEARPSAIILVADTSDSLRVVRKLRRSGFSGSIFGGPRMARTQFVSNIGDDAGELWFPLIASAAKQAKGGERQSVVNIDYATLQTYDSVKLTIEAIRTAGLNRVEIGRTLRKMSPWQGRSGKVVWDGLGGNTRPVQLATIRDGQLECPTVKQDQQTGSESRQDFR